MSSNDNLADIAARGMSPDELSSSIWWKGPIWISSQFSSGLILDVWTVIIHRSFRVKGSKTLYEAKLVCGEDLQWNSSLAFLILTKLSMGHCLISC